MKRLFLLPILLFHLAVFSQDCNIGNQIPETEFQPGGFFKNYLLGVSFNLSQEGTLRTLNMIGNGTLSGIQMAVYDDNAGVPNNLIAVSDFGVVTNGVVSLPVTPTVLPPGDYWIMAIYDTDGNNSDVNHNAGNDPVYYIELPFGDPIPTNASDFLSYTGQDFLYFMGIDCGNTLSITNLDYSQIPIAPNPAQDYILISGLQKGEEYKIVNGLGQIVRNGTLTNHGKINVESLSKGVYFFKFGIARAREFIKE